MNINTVTILNTQSGVEEFQIITFVNCNCMFR